MAARAGEADASALPAEAGEKNVVADASALAAEAGEKNAAADARTIKIATLQTEVHADKARNLAQVADLLGVPELTGVDLVVLPEMFCCPYDTSNFPVYAEPDDGAAVRFCSQLAAEHHVYLSAGSMPEVDRDGRVYNTAYVFDRDGQMIAKHRKVHLFDIDIEGGQRFRESDTLTAGDKVTVFSTELATMGLAICYDIRFPEMFLEMAQRGAELVIVPAAFNMTTGPLHWELLFRTRAVDDQVFCVGTAPARDKGGSYVSWGHSIITGPWGDVKMQMDETCGYRITTIDLHEVHQAREQLPVLKQR